MTNTKNFTNLQIYTIATNFLEQFKGDTELPVVVGYYIQKNMSIFVNIAKELDEKRTAIFDKYGTKSDEDGELQYHFDEDKVDITNQEIEDLFNESVEIDYYTLNLSDFDNINFSLAQLGCITWMIEE